MRVSCKTPVGKHLPPPKGADYRRHTPHQQAEALQRLDAGDTQSTVAALLDVDQATISRLYRREG